MAVSGTLARQPANLDDPADSENPKEDFTDFDSPARAPSFLLDSADRERPEQVDTRDSESSSEASEDIWRPKEDPTDNNSSTEVDYEAPKSGKPAELVSPAVLKRLRGRFTGATLDCQLPCTAAEGKACQLFDHLSAWNEFLCLARLQLRETTGSSGNLALVCCSRPVLKSYPSEKQRYQVYTLVYWLLKMHHCLVHVEFGVPEFEPYSHLLNHVLEGNSHVRSLKLWFHSDSREDQVPDIFSMTHLQELHCTGYPKATETLVSKLAHLLRTSTSLKTLRIMEMTLQGPSVEDFFRALGENRSLEELALPDSVIGEATPAARAEFTEFLKNSTSLKTLSFVAHIKEYFCLQWMLEGLVENKSVVSVSFEGLPADQAAVQLMAKIFTQNKGLRSFTCEYRHFSDLDCWVHKATKSDFDHLLKSLVQNDTLERVCLPIEFCNVQQWKALFEALPTKDSLKTLTIEAADRSTPLVLDVSAALEGTDAEEKVSFKGLYMCREDEEIFYCQAFSEAVVYADDFHSDEVCEFLERLPSLGHIKLLHLDLGLITRDDELSSAFTTFLGATRTLRTLEIRGFQYSLEDTIAQGMAINTSLREVDIRVDVASSDTSTFAEPLAKAINSSKNISRVGLNVDEHPEAELAFLYFLSLGIRNNYTLLSFKMSGPLHKNAEVYWFRVWDVVQRNRGLVTAAADFVRGVRRDRHCAMALEQVRHHPELVEEVARLECINESRAAVMVQESLRAMANTPDFV